MHAQARVAIVCGLLVLSSLVLLAPRAAADWCSNGTVTYSPTSGPAGTGVTFSFTFQNLWDATIQVSDFSALYSWGGISDFGPNAVAPWGSITGTGTVLLPSTAGAQFVDAEIYGQANTDPYPITCFFGPMDFTVTSVTPLTATASATPAATDVGVSVAFACTASGGSSPYSYSWSFGDGASGTGATPSHTYSVPGTMTVACTVTDSAATQTSALTSILVRPAPTVAITSTERAAAPGTILTFGASAAGGSGSFTYAWSFGDGTSGSGANPRHAYTAPGLYSLQVTAADSLGVTASASVPLAVAYLVATASVSETSALPGAAVTFTAYAAGGAGAPYAFRWAFGDGSTGTGATVSHAYSKVGAFTPTVTVTDAQNATNVTSLAPITVQSPPAGFSSALPGGLPVLELGIGIAAGAAAIGAAVWLLRRRGKASKPPSGPPGPPAAPPPPQP